MGVTEKWGCKENSQIGVTYVIDWYVLISLAPVWNIKVRHIAIITVKYYTIQTLIPT